MRDAAPGAKGLARRVPIFRQSVFWGAVVVAVVSVGAMQYIDWRGSLVLLGILAYVVARLEAEEEFRRLGPGKVNRVLETVSVFIWIVGSVLVGFFGFVLLGAWLLSSMSPSP